MELFGGFLDAHITRPIIDSFIFLEMKGANVVHLSCKFQLHLTCSSRLFNWQMFSYLQKADVKTPPQPLSLFWLKNKDILEN